MTMKVVSVNISEKKGVVKNPVTEIEVNDLGIVGDAHAGSWHRQVSILSRESVSAFEKEAGRTLHYGEFAENLTTEGLDLATLAVRDRLNIGDVLLEVSQIGKKCHGSNCSIFREVGKCVMPKEGIFCRVIKGGTIKAGDVFTCTRRPLKVVVITLSDRASLGVYEDRSGPAVVDAVSQFFADKPWHLEFVTAVIPDDSAMLSQQIRENVAASADVIITTGGTGIGAKDITPETLLSMFDKEIPGIMDYIRVKYGAALPQALMSRSVAGVIEMTQIYALPGSVKAVQEYMSEILKVLEHNIFMLLGFDAH